MLLQLRNPAVIMLSSDILLLLESPYKCSSASVRCVRPHKKIFWQTPACAGLVSTGFVLATVNQPGNSPETLGITVCVCVIYDSGYF